MAMDRIELYSGDVESRLNDIKTEFEDLQLMQQKAEKDLQDYKVSNLQKYFNQSVEQLNKIQKQNIDAENRILAARKQVELKYEKEKQGQLKRIQDFANEYNIKLSKDELQKAQKDAQTLYKLKEKLSKDLSDAEKFEFEQQLQEQIDGLQELQNQKEKIDKKAKAASKKEAKKVAKEKSKQKRDEVAKATKEGKEAGGLVGGAAAYIKASAHRYSAEDMVGTDAGKRDKAAKAANVLAGIDGAVSALSDFAKKLEKQIDEIGSYKSKIDTRLQGSNNETTNLGSYWDRMSRDITGIAGVSPLVKQADIVKNLQTMVDKGISFNVEQRAFLETVKEKIATTFDANNGTLLRLVRIQQADSTAARLGMESAMNTFLNSMYENTEYLKDVATTVKSSLEESMSFMNAVDAVGFEYQVQKWMGSLYSVGMSQNAVSGIAEAFGKLAAGDISAISDGGYGNLLVMAANKSNMSIADILAGGLDESETNNLLGAVVDYLAEISEQTADSHVVRQQMAKVFGVKGSDIIAASNLISSRNTIYNNSSNYSRSMQQLYNMAGSMYSRTGMGELLNNAWENTQYSMASGIANNPLLYGMYKASGLLDTVAGGIAIPAISVMGTMVDLETTVADLMRVGAFSGGILSSIGQMLSMGSGGGISGKGMLKAVGIDQNAISTLTRGNFNGIGISSGMTVSESTMVGNASGSDITGATMASANDTKASELSAAQENNHEVTLSDVNENVVLIATLLKQVTNGEATLHVHQDNVQEIPWPSPENVLGGSMF